MVRVNSPLIKFPKQNVLVEPKRKKNRLQDIDIQQKRSNRIVQVPKLNKEVCGLKSRLLSKSLHCVNFDFIPHTQQQSPPPKKGGLQKIFDMTLGDMGSRSTTITMM